MCGSTVWKAVDVHKSKSIQYKQYTVQTTCIEMRKDGVQDKQNESTKLETVLNLPMFCCYKVYSMMLHNDTILVLSFIHFHPHPPYHISLVLSRCLLIAGSWLKRLQVFQLSTVKEYVLLTPSWAGVCIQNTRMPSPLKREGLICHSFHWCGRNGQVCGWWMAWSFPLPCNQVFLVDSHA